MNMEYNFLTLLDSFADNGFATHDHLLNENDLITINKYFDNHLDKFKSAKIGRGQGKFLNSEVRSDQNLWLDGSETELKPYFKKIENIKEMLKKEFFLPIQNFETQLAHYPEGASYGKHKDKHKSSDARLISSVFYLNKNWTDKDGGQLMIYDQQKAFEVEPIENRLVIFKSEFEHEVLISRKSRKSITTWFRNDI